jgi:methylase of polypeptide subunit release factors
MRQLVGPTDPAMFDNSGGKPVFEDIPDGCYNNVFDFGSGCGRLARQMMQQSPTPAQYHGIDLHQGMVRWCQENLSKANGNFTFSHHNVFNP